MNLFKELKRRNVIRMAGLYLVGAWLLIQIAETLLPAFDVPGWVLRAMIILLALGFIPALVFSWLYELTPDGLKRDAEVNPSQSITAETAKRMDLLTLAAVLLVVALVAADRYWPNQNPPATSSASVPIDAPADTPASPPKVAVAAGDPLEEVSHNSIAVLPFVNMSADPEQEYFSDGIAEELLNRLAQFPDLKVAARTSAFQFKGKSLDVDEIGRQLKVAHILEGSVRKAGLQLRITAQLIDSRSGYHLWSETYDRDATDVFKVQDDIAGEIARALKTRLGGNPLADLPSRIADPAAYEDYLLGRSLIAKRWLENLDLAVAAFNRAIAKDPNYSAAHSGLAFALLLRPLWNGIDGSKALAEATTAAERALQLDADNAEGYMVRGMTALYRGGDADDARQDLERALALAPGSVDVLNMYGDLLHSVGALAEAEAIKRRAMLLDPLALVHPLNLADIMLSQRKPQQAIEFAEQAIALGASGFGVDRLVIAQVALGQTTQAQRALDGSCESEQDNSSRCAAAQVLILDALDQRPEALAVLDRIAERVAESSYADTEFVRGLLPWFYIELGEIGKATDYQRQCLDDACWFPIGNLTGHRKGSFLPEELSTDPDWLAVWADPRVADLMVTYRRNLTAWREQKQ